MISHDHLPRVEADTRDRTLTLYLKGRLDNQTSLHARKKAHRLIDTKAGPRLIFDLAGVQYMDTAGAVLMAGLETRARQRGFKDIRVEKMDSRFSLLLNLARKKTMSEEGAPLSSLSFMEKTGEKVFRLYEDINTFVTFTGEITWAFMAGLRHPGRIRWREVLRVAERSGVDALPIVALISFIVGLVMAFQAALPMKMFGAEIYVANLIGIAMVRELGPLMTAIVLAGRSASAFAAEIGTMKINEEIDALTVMGLEPVSFLILPRVMASTLVTPLLTLFANLVGILGGAVVILSFGYPFITYFNQVTGFVTLQDFLGGIVKCFVFGILIAATGCLRGYQTGQGASAVGESTTRAVVSSIILIAVFDGIFSVVYYCLGI